MLSRSDIHEAVPDSFCASAEAAARLRGAIFVNAALRTSTLSREALSEALGRLLSAAGTPETMDRAWGLDGVDPALIDAMGTWHDACFDHNVGAVLDGLGDETRVGVEVLRQERLWASPRRAGAAVIDAAAGQIAVVRDDNQVYFSSGSEWRPAKCGPGGFVDGEWVYLKDGALRALSLTTRSHRTIATATQVADRLWELTARSVGENATESRSEFSPGKMAPAVVPAQAGPLFCLSGCRPVERILVLDGQGNALLSHIGERCCGHMDWAVPAAGGWLVPHSHSEGVELIQSGGHGVRIRIEPGGRLAVVSRSAAEARVGVFCSGRLELLGPDMKPSLSLPIPWQDRTNVATQSNDGSRIAIGSAGGRVVVLARGGHVLGRLTLEWEVHAINFLDNDRILVAHGPGFITTIRILDRAQPAIRFYRVGEPFGEFSNFAPFPIEVDGLRWATSEHYYQAMKFPADSPMRERIRSIAKGFDSRKAAWREAAIDPDWDGLKEDVMLTALRAKFTQHEDLRALLLSTGDALLVEHTTNDGYWADGGDGSGLNRLGHLLMRVRDELRA